MGASNPATGHETSKETTTMEPTTYTLAQVCEEIAKDPKAKFEVTGYFFTAERFGHRIFITQRDPDCPGAYNCPINGGVCIPLNGWTRVEECPHEKGTTAWAIWHAKRGRTVVTKKENGCLIHSEQFSRGWASTQADSDEALGDWPLATDWELAE